MPTIRKNRSHQQIMDQKLIDGLGKHATAIPLFVIGGASLKAADVALILKERLASAAAVLATKATWQEAVQFDAGKRNQTKKVVAAVRQILAVAFSDSIDILADFGLKPPKVVIVSPDKKIEATAKAKATRAARHTMGRKQKLAITGAAAPPLAPKPPGS
ncbi:MAG: hypothetical protein ACREJ3_16875 [Polyangiaceae bacterium]